MSDIIIKATDLTKQYMKNTVVKGADISIRKGMICGLVGPNGAGKTTIMKMLGGLVIPTAGEIELFGEKSEKGLAHSRSRMSFMIETPYAKQNMTARQNLEKLRLQKGLPNSDRVDEVLKLVGLADTGKKSVKNFSLGMKQRLGIAGAMLTKPELMVLDEPVNGLDPEGIVEIRELLLKLNREEHITIVISSHLLLELSLLCTDYVFIRKGEIVETISAEDLNHKCHEFYHIATDNNSALPAMLENKLGIHDFRVRRDGSVELYERIDEIRLISKTLFENGIIPTEIHMHDANLEEFYMKLVGEENDQRNQSTEVSGTEKH
ncbi:MAG: ABC transporter ATP-binding protein [Ruminococcus sp.]|uniref:ABC transporter ATP-binding protein n=1 Tax=Ruminococcus sp. TaxID=41978 RepID=UPI0025FBE65B|nr:ABC transporter ATP-binding protein [Ruminococcus sp.]MBO4867377.1 ABC transporter ATP-binding protein [Ruminococcus sp.]